MITSLIKKYILPKEVDFLSALNEHSMSIKRMTDDLSRCFLEQNEESCMAILDDRHCAKEIKDKNMSELLNSFITPIDRESIYRVITELDWIAVSIIHFVLEAKAYKVTQLNHEYTKIFSNIQLQAELLTAGFKTVKSSPNKTADNAQRVRDTYNELVNTYVLMMAELADNSDTKKIFIQRELLSQLKEISKRMQMCANSLEDIVMKMS